MSIERLNFRDALGAFAPGESLRGVLLLTYNLDGGWFEEVIAPELFDRVVDHVLLIRDGRAVRSELRSVRCVRANAGYSTRIFHPKLLLAVTEQRALACIGSANLTRGGYEKNLELGSVFEVGPDGGPYRLFRDILGYIAGPLPRELGGEPLATLTAIEGALREALARIPTDGDGGPHRLLHNYDLPLWDQLLKPLARKRIRRVLVLSPYFEGSREQDALVAEDPPEGPGDDGSSFERLLGDLRFVSDVKSPVTVCFQENAGLTRLPVETIRRHAGQIELRTLDWTAKEARPLHAKLLLIQGTDADGTEPFLYVLGGSPNFTPAAFLRTPPTGNAELAVLTRLEGRGRTIDRVEAVLGLATLFPARPIEVAHLKTIDVPTRAPEAIQRTAADVTLLVGAKKIRVSLRAIEAGADRMRILAFMDGHWQVLSEIALEAQAGGEFAVSSDLFEEHAGMPPALRTDTIRIEFYRGAERLGPEDLPLNVDCPDQFHGLHRVGPALSSLDARIAQAGAGATATYREQARWLEGLRERVGAGSSLKVTRFQANLDQFFRNVHTGLRGQRERLKRNPRSPYTIRRTLRDLSRWLGEVTSPDAALPSDECRMFLIERLAEETQGLLRLTDEQAALGASLPQALVEMGLPVALDRALAWVRAQEARGAEEFRKQTLEALGNVRGAMAAARG